jgi:hypothetical protein
MMLTTGELRVQLERAGVTDVAEQKREEEKVGVGTELVATTWRPAGSSGRRGARTRKQQGRGAGLRRGDDDAWV